MARNASGTYSLPLPDVVAGTVIEAPWANTTLNDLKAEMTDSLSRSGKGGMTAPLLLQDGSAAAPALAFGLEPSTGLRRAGAGDLRAVVAGADRLQLTASILATSGLAAADAGTDFKINTTNVRTAGKLFDIQTGGTSRFSVGPTGVTFPLAPAVFTAGLAAESDLAAASAGTDFQLTTLFTRTAGALLDVQNNAASVFRVRFDGLLTAQSSLAAASGLTDFSFKTLATRTAGALLDVQNNGVSRFTVGPTLAAFVSGAAAADATTDFTLNSTATRTAGLLFAVQSGGTSRATINPQGFVKHGLGLASGMSTVPARVLIPSDVTCSSNTVAVNLGPAFSASSGKTYTIHGRFRVWAGSSTTGIGIGLKSTGGPTVSFIHAQQAGFNSALGNLSVLATTLSDTPPTLTDTAGVTGTAALFHTFSAALTTTSAGTLQLVIISEVNGVAVTVGAGSWFEITED